MLQKGSYISEIATREKVLWIDTKTKTSDRAIRTEKEGKNNNQKKNNSFHMKN